MESRSRGTLAAFAPVYNDFEPSIDWAREDKADTLLIYLPDFLKEQLNVQLTASRSLRIRGERRVSDADKTWSRFLKEIPLPSNYDANQITAKFEKGQLSIKLPKTIVPEAKQPPPPHEKIPEATPQPPQKETSQSRLTEASKPQDPSSKEDSAPEKLPSRQPTPPLEDPSPKTSMDKQQNGKTDEVADANDFVSEKHRNEKDPRKYEREGKSSNELADAGGKVPSASTSLERERRPSFLHAAKKVKDKAMASIPSGNIKLGNGNYKQLFGGLVTELRKPRKFVSLVLFILSIILVGMYAKNAIRSLRKSEN